MLVKESSFTTIYSWFWQLVFTQIKTTPVCPLKIYSLVTMILSKPTTLTENETHKRFDLMTGQSTFVQFWKQK